MAQGKPAKLSQSRDDAIAEMGSEAKRAMYKILCRAEFDGDADAARELYSCAATATNLLHMATERRPTLFKRIARQKISWPIEYSPHPEDRRAADLLMKELEVGEASGIHLSGAGKSFSWKKPANQIAYHLVGLMRVVQRHSLVESPNGSANDEPLVGLLGPWKPQIGTTVYTLEQLRALDEWGKKGPGSHLPPLTRETAPQWAKVIRDPFRIIFGRNCERDPRLKELRKSVERKWPGGLGRLRSLMLNAVKQAIKSIAPLK